MLGQIGGLRIIEDPNMLDRFEDWSQCRSPSRARRRRRRGLPQRCIITATPKTEVYRVGDSLVMHPQAAAALRAATVAKY